MPAGAVSAIYPLLPIYASVEKPHRVSIKVQRSADCPSSQIAHQLISETNSSSSVDGVKICEIGCLAGMKTCMLLGFWHMVSNHFYAFTWHQASRRDFQVICAH